MVNSNFYYCSCQEKMTSLGGTKTYKKRFLSPAASSPLWNVIKNIPAIGSALVSARTGLKSDCSCASTFKCWCHDWVFPGSWLIVENKLNIFLRVGWAGWRGETGAVQRLRIPIKSAPCAFLSFRWLCRARMEADDTLSPGGLDYTRINLLECWRWTNCDHSVERQTNLKCLWERLIPEQTGLCWNTTVLDVRAAGGSGVTEAAWWQGTTVSISTERQQMTTINNNFMLFNTQSKKK